MTHIVVHNGAWVLVGDGHKALFLINHGEPDLLDLRVLKVQQDVNPPTREQGSDAPGRASLAVSVGLGGHGTIENTDWHRLEKEHFATSIAAAINAAAESGEMSEIVIIAPPRVLGDLRHGLSVKARSKVKGEIDKDLTHHPVPEIEKALARLFNQPS